MAKDQRKYKYDVAVIGAGASGLMSAIIAAEHGASVIVLNHHAMAAKKILATGNGKCNFTNEIQKPEFYRSDDSDFVMEVLRSFTAQDTLRFFRQIGVMSKSRDGYCYPRSAQAVTIREALLQEARRLKVRIWNNVSDIQLNVQDDMFVIHADSAMIQSKKCILATGGKASPKSGSDGSGYRFAKQMGHSIKKPLPALVPLVSGEKWLKDTAGVRCDATVSLYIDGTFTCSDTGEVQMTDYGISGIPVFQISRYASLALEQKKKVYAVLDFVPEMSQEELSDYLNEMIDSTGFMKSWFQILSGICNSKLASMIASRVHASDVPICENSQKNIEKTLKQVVRHLKSMEVTIIGTKTFEQAQVTCGGIPVTELGTTMESRFQKSFYCVGEVVDVDAICGGYNLQWAWSSAYAAGIACSKE